MRHDEVHEDSCIVGQNRLLDGEKPWDGPDRVGPLEVIDRDKKHDDSMQDDFGITGTKITTFSHRTKKLEHLKIKILHVVVFSYTSTSILL
jgi:hypothetical protein